MQGAAPDTTPVLGAAPDTTLVLATAGRDVQDVCCEEHCWTNGCDAAGATCALESSTHVSPETAHELDI